MKLSIDPDLEFRQRLGLVILALAPSTLGVLVNHLMVQSWSGYTSRIDWLGKGDYGYYLENYLSALL